MCAVWFMKNKCNKVVNRESKSPKLHASSLSSFSCDEWNKILFKEMTDFLSLIESNRSFSEKLFARLVKLATQQQESAEGQSPEKYPNITWTLCLQQAGTFNVCRAKTRECRISHSSENRCGLLSDLNRSLHYGVWAETQQNFTQSIHLTWVQIHLDLLHSHM